MKADGLLALAVALALGACSKAPDSPARGQAVKDGDSAGAVRAAEQAQLQAFRNRDVNGVLAGYAPDATLMMGGQGPLSGAEAIRASLTREVADPGFSIALDNKRTQVGAGGDIAYTAGAYHVTYTDPGTRKPVSEDGHYVTVFRRQPDGAWKAVEDIASPGPPPAAAGE
jgi:uncharacterized protein (TIGR02246 family)